MELSKDEPIFKSIDLIKNAIAENKGVTLKIHNIADWSEGEFNNFTSIMRSNYKEVIDDEILEVKRDDNYLIISKIANIREYNNSNTYSGHHWENRTIVKSDKIDNLFDVNFEIEVYDKKEIEEIANWSSLNKVFRFIKKFNYDLGNGITAVASIVKTNDLEFDTLRKSKVLSLPQRYEFSLIIKDTKSLLDTIIIIIKALFMSNIILTKKQQQEILESYSSLVTKDMQLPKYFKEVPLLTPKPITLEKVNLINPDDYGAISILRGYAVTEKADGERILMYINNKGKVFLINSSLKVEDTGIIAKKEAYNSLIDGEYVYCNKRTDEVKKNLFAAFDIYYLNGNSLTSLPLIQGRYEELMKVKKLLDLSKSSFEFSVKVHHHSLDILSDCKKILNNPHDYPYEIDGLIFTPAKLSVYGFYPSVPVPITQNMGWDRLFKWKPPEQNTIDFLVKLIGIVKKDGIKYKKLGLYVGFNPISNKDITIDEGLKLRYDKAYSKMQFLEMKDKIKNKEDFIPVLFKPIIYYTADVEFAFIMVDSKGDIRTESNEKIDTDTIIEFRYELDKKQWIPMRIREDKTRIYKKGSFSKTANSLPVAINVWRSIHNPISKELIIGSADLLDKDVSSEIQGKSLEADDIYYSRGIPRRSLLSYNMTTFHNLGIKEMLYLFPEKRNSLLELACGQAGDLSRWLKGNYSFVFGIDYAKDNIYKPNEGAYARMIKEYNRFNKEKAREKGFFPNFVFAAGDCGVDIKTGASGVDDESKEIMKLVMNNSYKNNKPHYKHIIGRGANKFDVVTCMYALHYFFESEEKLHGFLNNVSSNLKTGGSFVTTFMDGDSVERALGNEGIVEGRKVLNNTDIIIWAIIKRFTNEVNYNRKVDVFIENTQRLIPEYLVKFDFLIEKAKEFGLVLQATELYSETFQKLKDKINPSEQKQTDLDKSLLELDKQDIQKKFSFLNRWVVFKKIEMSEVA
jgi:2-polyprenyl-3-methyl-5-hydroxy-6-metoxy-1,4-benzoquinol methylase